MAGRYRRPRKRTRSTSKNCASEHPRSLVIGEDYGVKRKLENDSDVSDSQSDRNDSPKFFAGQDLLSPPSSPDFENEHCSPDITMEEVSLEVSSELSGIPSSEARELARLEALTHLEEMTSVLKQAQVLQQRVTELQAKSTALMAYATPTLPMELWTTILVYAAEPGRHASLALVSRTWAAIIRSELYSKLAWKEHYGGEINTSLRRSPASGDDGGSNKWSTALRSTAMELSLKRQKGDTRVLWWAGKRGHHRIVSRMIQEGHKVTKRIQMRHGSSQEIYTCTVLYLAAMHDRYDVAELLLNNGAHTSECGRYGQTPLHIAAQRGSNRVVELLIRRGASIEARDNQGNTPLLLATAFGQLTSLNILLRAGANAFARNLRKQTILHAAAYPRDGSLVQRLLCYRKLLDCRDSQGRTPLFQCARCLFEDGVRLFLSAGADRSIPDISGTTPAQAVLHNEAIGELLRP